MEDGAVALLVLPYSGMTISLPLSIGGEAGRFAPPRAETGLALEMRLAGDTEDLEVRGLVAVARGDAGETSLLLVLPLLLPLPLVPIPLLPSMLWPPMPLLVMVGVPPGGRRADTGRGATLADTGRPNLPPPPSPP